MAIPTRDCPLHGKQKVYSVCNHLVSLIGDAYVRNQEPIGTILPPRQGWVGFVVCSKIDHNPNHQLAICERCCIQFGILREDQLGKAFFLQPEPPPVKS